jgi:uncharacterized protein
MAKSFSLADLPQTIPIFPLSGALLLPHASLPLNIFEPRYLAMLEDSIKTRHRLIGMVQPHEPPRAKPGDKLHKIGCAGRVVAFQETHDGRYLITLAGVCRFEIVTEQAGFTPYLRADVRWDRFADDLGRSKRDEDFDRSAFLDLLDRYFKAMSLTADWDSLRDAPEERLINSLAILCPFELEEKQALLEAADLRDRRETLVTLMEFALQSGGEGTLQ